MKSKPTVIVHQYKNAAETVATSNKYGNLRIHALPGLHNKIGILCSRHIKNEGKVLDLAAGSGAMSMRLKDLGFHPTAVDYVQENFKALNIPFHQLDLNEDFTLPFKTSMLFDGIIASEIIEHLENPYHFFRQCNALLKPGGKLVLSTPNTQNTASIANFLRTGQFLWFSDADRCDQGHITPLTQWQIRYAIAAAGMHIEYEESFGEKHSKMQGSERLLLLSKFLNLASRTQKSLLGEIYICVVSKSPQLES